MRGVWGNEGESQNTASPRKSEDEPVFQRFPYPRHFWIMKSRDWPFRLARLACDPVFALAA